MNKSSLSWMFSYRQLMLVILSAWGYLMLGYFTPRTEFGELLSWFGMLFLLYYFLVFKGKGVSKKEIMGYGIFFQLILFWGIPVLSDDIYRFIWDGRMLVAGMNPYLYLPEEVVGEAKGLSQSLYGQLNSQQYYSVYPPVNQFLFGLSSWVAGESLWGNVLVLRGVLVGAWLGSGYFLFRILDHWNIPRNRAAWFLLNPLVIVESIASLHFELLMVFFMLWAFHEWIRGRMFRSATAFGLSVVTKLIPLILLPFLIQRLGWKGRVRYFSVIVGIGVLLFLPFYSEELFSNFWNSLDLYFQKFEFNASIYYLVRWVGFEVKGYNIIQQAGPVLSAITFFGILGMAVKESEKELKSVFPWLIAAFALHYFLATTVHPWYLIPLVLFSVFSGHRFPLVWSALIVLSYFAYANGYEENYWLVAIEYGGVLGFIGWQWAVGR